VYSPWKLGQAASNGLKHQFFNLDYQIIEILFANSLPKKFEKMNSAEEIRQVELEPLEEFRFEVDPKHEMTLKVEIC
jgi:hypothetical protein